MSTTYEFVKGDAHAGEGLWIINDSHRPALFRLVTEDGTTIATAATLDLARAAGKEWVGNRGHRGETSFRKA